MALEVSVKGLAEVEDKLRRLAKELGLEVVFPALYRKAEFMMTDSKENYCPVRDGHLRGSGHVVADKSKMTVTMGYGGPAGIGNVGPTNKEAVGYAIVQHENEDYSHTVGQAKYLERPVFKEIPNIARDVAADARPEVEQRARKG
jgi:hypothetical protein